MLTHPTLDQLHQLGLTGMARAFTELEANPSSVALSHAEWLALLLDREATDRHDRRLQARLRYARLRHQAVRRGRRLPRRPWPRPHVVPGIDRRALDRGARRT